MRLLIDVQTLYTNEKNRGIGIYTYNWLKNIVTKDKASRFFLMRKKNNTWQFTFVSEFLSLDDRINRDQYWEESDINEFILRNKIDIIHFTSPFMFDIEVPDMTQLKVKKTYLVYDLIPIIMKEHYYDTWPDHIRKIYDERCKIVSKADLILTISQASKNDLVQRLSINPGRIEVIYASTNEELYQNSRTGMEPDILEEELGLSSPFIYSLTGYDVRKNNKGLIKAFSNISSAYPELKLVISGIKNDLEQNEFKQYASSINAPVDRIIFLGFVSEECLLALYRECEVFVFPSLYEGFGLPVLEAMRVGAPVITTNCSSLVEVAGEAAILVKPDDDEELVQALHSVLEDSTVKQQLKEKSLKQSQFFNWNNVTLDSMQTLKKLLNNIMEETTNGKPILAFVSPLAPQVSGIADYSEEMLIYLRDYFEIKIIVNGITPSNAFISENFEVIDVKKQQSRLDSISYRLYHMGNNELHDWIYELLKKYPGTVLLHDLNLFGFFMHTTFVKGFKEQFRNELTYAYGPEGFEAGRQLLENGTYPNSQQFPLFHRVVDLSNGLIVHSKWLKETIETSASFTGDIKVVPHGVAFDPSLESPQVDEMRNHLRMDPKKFTIGVFGNMIPNKRIDVIIRCFASLLKTNPNTDLYIVGHAEQNVKQDLLKLVKHFGISHNVKFIYSPDIIDFKRYIMASNLCINLRWPTMGETSGTLTRALGYGIPCIVSNVGSYQEYPDNCVWKVDCDVYEEELLLAYLLELVNNKGIRSDMSQRALEFIKSCDFKNTTKEISHFILRK